MDYHASDELVHYTQQEREDHNLPLTHKPEEFKVFAAGVEQEYRRMEAARDHYEELHMRGELRPDDHPDYVDIGIKLANMIPLSRAVRWTTYEIRQAEIAKLHGWLLLEFNDRPDDPGGN